MSSPHNSAMATSPTPTTDQPELSIRALLDHVAVELAQEYIRLMEAAAEAETTVDQAQSGENR